VSKEANLHTDEMYTYKYIAEFGAVASHDKVNHSKDEYVRYEGDKVSQPTLWKASIRFSNAA